MTIDCMLHPDGRQVRSPAKERPSNAYKIHQRSSHFMMSFLFYYISILPFLFLPVLYQIAT